MTPEEAVDKCISDCGCAEMDGLEKVNAACRDCIVQLVANTKATETRRCAARVRLNLEAAPDMMLKPLGKKLANDILTTGGLETED